MHSRILARALSWTVIAGLTWAAVRGEEARSPSSLASRPLAVCLVSGSKEYRSAESLAELESQWEREFGVKCFRAFGEDKGEALPGIEALDTCDAMVLFARRLTLPSDQMAAVRRFVEAGKPIFGIRTASHAFQNWRPDSKSFDREILGGSYDGHYENAEARVERVTGEAGAHPILAGVKGFTTRGKLYKNPKLAEDAVTLLTATADGREEPVAWVRTGEERRVFYTSLGTPEDFRNENFRRLLDNALMWLTDRARP